VEIMTERLLLREFIVDDAPAFLAYHADPRQAEFYGPEEASPEHARELLRLFCTWASELPRHNYQLAIADLRDPRQLLGCCGLRRKGMGAGTAEFGLELVAASWGRGYATEAARALLGFGFRELRLEEVRSESVSANARVVALAQRIGLLEVGTRPGPAWMSARGWHYIEWLLTRGRWEPPAIG
jgi:[ribosomal protein S5]-alanine N-acetyltransferase